MSAFVIRSLWEVPATIVVGTFVALLIVWMIYSVIRLVILFLIVLVGAPFAIHRGRAANRAATQIPTTYDRNGQPDPPEELNP